MQLKVIRRKGYNIVEAIPGTLPVYDEYNIAHETEKMFPVLIEHQAVERILFGSDSFRECQTAEDASRRMIESALERLR